jgi:two-component system, LytTR family, sensor kinase
MAEVKTGSSVQGGLLVFLRRPFFKHVFAWLGYYLILCCSLVVTYPDDWVTTVTDTCFQGLIYIASFYTIYHAVFAQVQHREKMVGIIVAIANLALIYVITLFAVHFLHTYLLPLLPGERLLVANYAIAPILATDVLFSFLQFVLYAYLFSQFNRRIRSEALLRKEQNQKLELQNAKLKTEYDYLKSQINPHFLYNTLNFLYSKSLKQDKEMAQGISHLSDLMRYSLDAGGQEGKVLLADEVMQIENYISLQQFRFSQQLCIRFLHDEEIPETINILPHSLLTLVENAFKYGVTDDPAHPLNITLTLKPGSMLFEVRNKISHRQADRGGTGIGLENLQKRLALEYAGRHIYRVENDGTDYAVLLALHL